MDNELKSIKDFLVVSSTITKVDSENYIVQPEDELLLITSNKGCYITLPSPENGKKLIIKDGSGFSSKFQIQAVDKNKNFYINSSYGSLRLLGDGKKWKSHDNYYGFGKMFLKQTNVCSNGILYNEIPFRSGFFSDYNLINIENRNGTVIKNYGPDQKWNVIVNISKDNNFSIHVGDKVIENENDVVIEIKNGETFWVSVSGVIEKSSLTIIQIA